MLNDTQQQQYPRRPRVTRTDDGWNIDFNGSPVTFNSESDYYKVTYYIQRGECSWCGGYTDRRARPNCGKPEWHVKAPRCLQEHHAADCECGTL